MTLQDHLHAWSKPHAHTPSTFPPHAQIPVLWSHISSGAAAIAAGTSPFPRTRKCALFAKITLTLMSRSLTGKGSHCAADVMRAHSSFPPCRVDGRKSWSHGVGVTRPRRLRQEGLSPPVPSQDVLPAAAWMLFKEADLEGNRCHP